ncbi:hypothetical protein JR316_0000018 [Psilocybe cubensis]|uniref:Uncharacterized protein n=6 Tax=Psilocybe cubensis TaxID=181762 RepID=A0A8H7Y9I8_PSICU|nr:hypothetical protein JR316_0011935 [Psilocybe cubensis]XP_047745533.1 hypothetical protein JR316_0010140 [Psilocybe cubensis]XP_047750938.1 hypothetical protein JR316_0005419 [Psilocybe cubensis]XP_047751635.1 hypothetical protein JR316_0003489 [Psilocybe cubensis]XP_047753582.1 hypothetical protein JR316_0000018 [Psilocybe cubensis]KAH9476360.1 hypothetical protein JR316_0011935 [Psilocybe cubensis]KAH9477908.1 hypothetical protein JR316_0010140 [Psilocybe cubensis]KAH9483313.1 hypotheti
MSSSHPSHEYIRHLPLITPRIEFLLPSQEPLPKITPRIQWTPELLQRHAIPRGAAPQPSSVAAPGPEELIQAEGPSGQDTVPVPPIGPSIATPATHVQVDPGQPIDPAMILQVAGPSHPRVTSPVPGGEMYKKPKGEPGRRGSGGFNIQTVLRDDFHWSEEDIGDMVGYITREARRSLDMSKSYRSQKKEKIEAICQEATRRWPVLRDYDKCWPVHSVLKLKLKYRAEAHRRVEGRRESARVRAALANIAGVNDAE